MSNAQPAPAGERITQAELTHEEEEEPLPPPRPRRVVLPVVLLCLTLVSTCFVGATRWNFITAFMVQSGAYERHASDRVEHSGYTPVRRMMLRLDWQCGLTYAACLLGILLAHEMGHFVFNQIYRVPGSLPYFIPFPFSPMGTMGAVIVMQAHKTNRRELFDIGLAGPLAGLVVCVPVLWIGVSQLDLTRGEPLGMAVDLPLALRWALEWSHTPGYTAGQPVSLAQTNPYFVAGWVGLLITGLNMMPVSQLDGGHVTFALFGRQARLVARGFFLLAVGYSIIAQNPSFSLMFILIFLIGIDHPPTADDAAPLGPYRTILGYASLLIPVLTFAPRAFLV